MYQNFSNLVHQVKSKPMKHILFIIWRHTAINWILTVTVSPEPIFITESLSFLRDSLNSFISFRVHIEAAARGGKSSTNTTYSKVTKGKQNHANRKISMVFKCTLRNLYISNAV